MTWRVAKRTRGALSAPVRTPAEARETWGRYDTPGRTLYTAESRQTALMEVLSPFKRRLGEVNPLEKDAAALGMSVDDFAAQVGAEWDTRDFMRTGCVPAVWRNERAWFSIRFPPAGWWVDLEHPDSIAAVSRNLTEHLVSRGIDQLTTAHLRGEDRQLTTGIAQWVRNQVLDDGSEPLGIQFGSKHGGGNAWAYWMRQTDLRLGKEPVTDISESDIPQGSADLKVVCDRLGIRAH